MERFGTATKDVLHECWQTTQQNATDCNTVRRCLLGNVAKCPDLYHSETILHVDVVQTCRILRGSIRDPIR